MNQLKYPLYACLLLLFLWIGVQTIYKFSGTRIIEQKTLPVKPTNNETPPVADSKGKQLFRQNCASCHALDKDLTGPGLIGVEQRGPWTDRKNLMKWVRNPAAFIAANSYAAALREKYMVLMNAFPQLTDQEINEIFDYIKNSQPSEPSLPSQSVAMN